MCGTEEEMRDPDERSFAANPAAGEDAMLDGPDDPAVEPGLATSASDRYRATFKHRTNEAEPPRSSEFTAAQPADALSEARRLRRSDEVIVDVVPLG
jgi:hypothetical protein